jgi:hypothetical protein
MREIRIRNRSSSFIFLFLHTHTHLSPCCFTRWTFVLVDHACSRACDVASLARDSVPTVVLQLSCREELVELDPHGGQCTRDAHGLFFRRQAVAVLDQHHMAAGIEQNRHRASAWRRETRRIRSGLPGKYHYLEESRSQHAVDPIGRLHVFYR